MLAQLATSAGRRLIDEHRVGRMWGTRSGDDLRPMGTIVRKLRQELGDDAGSPRYILTEPRVGYRMADGEP